MLVQASLSVPCAEAAEQMTLRICLKTALGDTVSNRSARLAQESLGFYSRRQHCEPTS